MPLYRKRPVVVEATRFFTFADHPAVHFVDGCFKVHGANGWVEIRVGDWVITEPDGLGHYPCADSIFRQNYERVTEPLDGDV